MIHTNELMLGNWVEYATGLNNDKRSIPMYVTGIFSDTVYLNFDGNEGDPFEILDEDLRGIPITEGMIEKLGWPKTHSGTYRSYYGDEQYETFVTLEHKYGTYVLTKTGQHCGDVGQLRYIHELQNAYYLLTRKHLEVKL